MDAPRKPDLALARIHGWLCGDGRVESRFEKGKHSPHLEVRFFPDDKHVAHLFCTNFDARFGRTPIIYDTRLSEGCFTVRLRDKGICKFILSIGPFGHYRWRMPCFDYQAEKIEWVKCFFDDEAHVNESGNCIQVKSVNRIGLRKVGESLIGLGIGATLYGPYTQRNPKWSSYSMLVIPESELRLYQSLIGFNHVGKNSTLMSLLR